jgi:hypothetical protein
MVNGEGFRDDFEDAPMDRYHPAYKEERLQ